MFDKLGFALDNPFFTLHDVTHIATEMFDKFPETINWMSFCHLLESLYHSHNIQCYALTKNKKGISRVDFKDIINIDTIKAKITVKKQKANTEIIPVATVDEPVSLPFELYHKPRQTVVVEEQLDPELISYMNIQVDHSDPDYLLKLLKSFTE